LVVGGVARVALLIEVNLIEIKTPNASYQEVAAKLAHAVIVGGKNSRTIAQHIIVPHKGIHHIVEANTAEVLAAEVAVGSHGIVLQVVLPDNQIPAIAGAYTSPGIEL